MSSAPEPVRRRRPVRARSPVALTRTAAGLVGRLPRRRQDAADLVEGLSLADLVAEELGALTEPDRTARRSARGPATGAAEPADPVDARMAALERTVAQLEHALAARVSTERAIGVLAERHGTSARARLRVAAPGRPLPGPPGRRARPRGARRPGAARRPPSPPADRSPLPARRPAAVPACRRDAPSVAVAAADGRS